MPIVTEDTIFRNVEHILASGSGTLDFAIVGDSEYHTWHGREDAEWTVEDAGRVENTDEDRLVIYPQEKYFICEIEARAKELNDGVVWCYCRKE